MKQQEATNHESALDLAEAKKGSCVRAQRGRKK